MLQVFKKETKLPISVNPELINEEYDFSNQWIHMINPTDKEIELIAKSTNVPDEVIKAALDEEEAPRIEIEDDYSLILTDIPFTEDDEEDHYTYSTLPFACIITKSCVITVCIADTSIVTDILSGRIKDINIEKRKKFSLQIQMAISKKFLWYLTQIQKSGQRVQAQLEKKMKNEDIMEMMDLQKALVYFTTSLRSNSAVMERIPKQLRLSEDDVDYWEDVVIECKQAIDMSTIYREIMRGQMDTYASIINNDMNRIMKILTSLTLIIAIPSMIGAFWGMNLPGIPFAGHPWGFWIVIAISVVVVIAVIIILWKRKMFK